MTDDEIDAETVELVAAIAAVNASNAALLAELAEARQTLCRLLHQAPPAPPESDAPPMSTHQYGDVAAALREHATSNGAKEYATADDAPSTSPHVLALRLARHAVHHGAALTPGPGGAVTVEWPRPGRTVRVVWLPVVQAARTSDPHDLPEWTADSRAYGKGAEDASRMRGWRLSRAGYKAWAEAVGLSGDDGEWFAYETGQSDWWISYEGR
ncbi:hypothetical protein ACIQF6_19570 [Kitasatospora sp. NPDC092948]|uniref:hypothetical protein n=1 Tax=Kitasatospora sp. NPDC092948 TaxID=3364088 RepID=UPI003812EAC7